ncbi:MAG: hypothetical protein WCG09_00735 [Halobacteriota archaeon]|jgi:hypothetical protein
MWLKTKIGKHVNVKSTQENAEWDGALVEVDAAGLTINNIKTGLTFIPLHNIFAVHVLET